MWFVSEHSYLSQWCAADPELKAEIDAWVAARKNESAASRAGN